MKTILTTVTLISTTICAFADGTLLFDNNASGEVDVGTIGNAARAIGESQQNIGNQIWNMALMFNPTGTLGLPQSAFVQIVDYIPSATSNPLIDGDGSFQYGSGNKAAEVYTGAPAGIGTFEVVSWLGTATTWAQASAGIGATYIAQSTEFDFKTADSSSFPPGVPIGINRLINGTYPWDGNLLLEPVPDGSNTLFLGGVGFAGLLLFRRRLKNAA